MEDELRYLAGLFDGEGWCCEIKRGGHTTWELGLKMTNRDAVERFAEALNLTVVKVPSKNPRWQDQWRTKATYRKAREAAAALLPYTFIKSEQLIACYTA